MTEMKNSNKIIKYTLENKEGKIFKFIGTEVSLYNVEDNIVFNLTKDNDEFKNLINAKVEGKLTLINYNGNKSLRLLKKELYFNDTDSIPYNVSSISDFVNSFKKRRKAKLAINEDLFSNREIRNTILSDDFLENKDMNNNIIAEILLLFQQLNLQKAFYKKKGKKYYPKNQFYKKIMRFLEKEIPYLDQDIIDFIIGLDDNLKAKYLKFIEENNIKFKNIDSYFNFYNITESITKEEINYMIKNFRNQITTDNFWENNKFRDEILDVLLIKYWGSKITNKYPKNRLYKKILSLAEGKLTIIDNEIAEYISESKMKDVFITNLKNKNLMYKDVETYNKINNNSILAITGNNIFKESFFKETPNSLISEILIEYSKIIAVDKYPKHSLYSNLLKLIDKKLFSIDWETAIFLSNLEEYKRKNLLKLIINDAIEFKNYKTFLKTFDHIKIYNLLLEFINNVEKFNNAKDSFINLHNKFIEFIGKTLLENREMNNDFLYPIIPNCYFPHLIYCEGKKSKKGEDYWCRGEYCKAQDLLSKVNVNKKYANWSLFEVFEHYSIKINFNKIYELKGIKNLEDYITKIGGALNRLIELRDRLKCKECREILNFNWEYAKNKAAYRLTVVRCENQDCTEYQNEIYLNHCWGCGEIIDSREGNIKRGNLYLCIHCGSGPQTSYNYSQGDLCPKCGSTNMQGDGYRDFTCLDCNHNITIPFPNSGKITGQNNQYF